MEIKAKEELDKGLKTLWITWAAMIGSLAIYVVICHLTADEIAVAIESDFPLKVFRNGLFIISAVELALIPLIRKAVLKIRPNRHHAVAEQQGIEGDYKTVLGKYTTAMIISLALAESIGIYGVVLFFISKDFLSLYIFIAISAAAMFIYRPKREHIEKLAEDMKPRI